MKICIFMMCKNELDIIEQWLTYYGKMFGYKNLFVLDHMSTDGTWELLVRYSQEHGVHVIRERGPFTKKGFYATRLIQMVSSKYDIAIPVDTDEFITYYDPATKCLSPESVVRAIHMYRDPTIIYKMRYLQGIDTGDSYENGNAVAGITSFSMVNLRTHNKAFLYAKNVNCLDSGFHCCIPATLKRYSGCLETNLCLVHYHSRGFDLFRDKSYKIVKGRGMDVNNVKGLQEIIKRDPNALGGHHIRRVIADIQGKLRTEWQAHNAMPVTTNSMAIWDYIRNEPGMLARFPATTAEEKEELELPEPVEPELVEQEESIIELPMDATPSIEHSMKVESAFNEIESVEEIIITQTDPKNE